jgi:hypothetical protein
MIMSFHAHDVAQCEQANHWLNRRDACSQPTPQECVKGGWPDFQQWGFGSAAGPDNDALSFDEVRSQIDEGRPFAFSWRWTGGHEGHMMVAAGYSILGGNEFVHVNDPFPVGTGDASIYTYSNFVGGEVWQGGSAPHTHWRDYYDIMPDATAARGGAPGGGGGPSVPLITQDATPEGAVERGTSILAELIDTDEATELVRPESAPGGGAQPPPDEASPALAVSYLFQEQLLAYKPGMDVRDLLIEGEELIVPLLTNGEVSSSVVIARMTDGWAIRRIGNPNFTRAVSDARAMSASESGRDLRDYRVVLVPQMYRVFLAREEERGLMLTPVIFQRAAVRAPFDAAPGTSRIGDEVLARLANDAVGFVGALPADTY